MRLWVRGEETMDTHAVGRRTEYAQISSLALYREEDVAPCRAAQKLSARTTKASKLEHTSNTTNRSESRRNECNTRVGGVQKIS